MDRIIREVEKDHRVQISYEIQQKVESQPTAADAPVVKALSRAIEEVYRVATKTIGIGSGTVGAYLRNAGYPCVVWSRLDETAHKPNEYAKIENIVGDAKVFAALMLRE